MLIRVLIAKVGLDGHDRGAKYISRALSNAGMEVIYTGIRKKPEEIVHIALQEDVHVIGLSCLSGAHNKLFPEVVEELKKRNAGEILVIGGGTIPEDDFEYLKSKGIEAIFTSGTGMYEIVDYIHQHFHRKDNS